jgi:glycosyltransferase involved in cell wall biosynthesis
VRTLLKPASQGKAAGLNDAIKLATGEVLLFTDARQQIESGALRLLIENFADPDVGAASGELMLGDPASGETGKGMGLYWRIEKKFASWNPPPAPSSALPAPSTAPAATCSKTRPCPTVPSSTTFSCPCRSCARGFA